MKNLFFAMFAFLSLSAYADEFLSVDVHYFADHHIEAESRSEAQMQVNAEEQCLKVVKAAFTNPGSLRIRQTENGKAIFGARLKSARMIRIYPDYAKPKVYAPLCKLEVYYK